MQNATVEPLVTFDLKALREFHETERDVVSVLAGALLASCIKVNQALPEGALVSCRYRPYSDELAVCRYGDVPPHGWKIWLSETGAAEHLQAAINGVLALGEVSA